MGTCVLDWDGDYYFMKLPGYNKGTGPELQYFCFSQVLSPKVKTKRTWADTKITLTLLTLSGRKVFQILAFFLISIFHKTYLNIQNPTARTPTDGQNQ